MHSILNSLVYLYFLIASYFLGIENQTRQWLGMTKHVNAREGDELMARWKTRCVLSIKQPTPIKQDPL